MDIKLREIKRGDNPIIARVIRTVLEEHGVNKPGTVYTDPTTDALFELFRTPNSFYLIAELDHEIVGGCGIFPTKGLPNNYAELVKLYLLPSSRGKKIGQYLMQECANRAKNLGYSHLYLESLPELNNALGLYEKMGFEYINQPLGDSGHHACDIWMVREL